MRFAYELRMKKKSIDIFMVRVLRKMFVCINKLKIKFGWNARKEEIVNSRSILDEYFEQAGKFNASN